MADGAVTDRNIIRVEGSPREFHRLKILAVLLLPLSMSLMAISAVNVALPTIAEGLGASDTDLQWVLAGYGLSFGVSLIPAGRAGDVLGRGSWFVAGLVIFVLSSLACGLAPNPVLLNIARLFQGLGAGVFSPQVTGMIQQYFTGGGRAKAFAMFGLVISVSVAIGPVLAGAIITALGPETGWRWAFLINTPLGVLGIVLALLWFPFETERGRRGGRGATAERLDLDPVGMLLVTATILAVMVPFMANSAGAWALLPLAPLLGWLWVRWERRYAAKGGSPMVQLRLFGFPSFRNGMLVSGTMFVGVASTFAVVAIFLQSGLGLTAAVVGLVGLPNAAASAFSSIWSVRYVMEHGRGLVALMLGLMVLGTLSSVGVALLIPHGAPWWLLAGTLMLNGFAMGAVGSANQTLSLQDVPPEHGGAAGGIKQTVERVGAALGNAIVTGVFFAVAPLGWSVGFAAAYLTIAGFIALAMTLAILDRRHHRRR